MQWSSPIRCRVQQRGGPNSWQSGDHLVTVAKIDLDSAKLASREVRLNRLQLGEPVERHVERDANRNGLELEQKLAPSSRPGRAEAVVERRYPASDRAQQAQHGGVALREHRG